MTQSTAENGGRAALPEEVRHLPLDRQFRVWLVLNGQNQADAAAAMGISESLLSRVLTGRRAMTVDVARRLAEYTSGAIAAEAAEELSHAS
jgi:antitoxin component HigA of HigAB toxin-antitoxin module